MSRYIETQTRKLIGSLAGVGALVEDIKGVVKILPLEKWKFFKENKHLDTDNHLNDTRLIYRLKHDKGFPNIKALVQVPSNSPKSFSKSQNLLPEHPDRIVSGRYFPEWMFCPKCKRFNPISKWLRRWKGAVEQYDAPNIKFAMDNFIPPKCGFCFEELRKNKKKNPSPELIQVRFVMTSANGEIQDIPWDKWIDIKKKGIYQGGEVIDLSDYSQCCENPDLYYIQGDREDFTGIRVECKSCKEKQNLKGMFGLKVSLRDSSSHSLKAVVRSSNSVYYPILVHSLFLPVETQISEKDQQKIIALGNKGKSADDIADFYEQYSVEDIKTFLNQSFDDGSHKETDYRRSEYKFFLAHKTFRKDSFIFQHENLGNLVKFGISNLTKVSRLKMTTIQTGYTRQEPLDADLFLSDDYGNIRPQYTSTKGKNAEYLAGIENFGEGIFIDFENDFINKKIQFRATELQDIFSKSKNSPLFKNKFDNWEHMGRFMYVHTFSHLIMKELEFSCGYPTVSLSERLFVDNGEMQGLLIYTVGGLEGGYGGLSSQAEANRFERLIDSAFERAEDCSSDPICYHSEGQGIGEMNMAACYSCALVAENACEAFNSFLDRKIILQK